MPDRDLLRQTPVVSGWAGSGMRQVAGSLAESMSRAIFVLLSLILVSCAENPIVIEHRHKIEFKWPWNKLEKVAPPSQGDAEQPPRRR